MTFSIRERSWLLTALTSSVIILASSCDPHTTSDDTVLMHNDFESLTGWLGQAPQPSLTTERAHSGRYSLKVDKATEFSLSYATTMGQLSTSRLTKLKLDAWVFAPSADAGALLVTNFSDGIPTHKALLWNGFDVVKASQQYGEWVHVSQVLDMPAALTADTQLGIYLWRNKGELPTYLDDLTISAAP